MAEKWPKPIRDYTGRYVRLLREKENNGGEIFIVGTIMKITGYYRGLELERISRCPLCGKMWRGVIKRVHLSSVELLPPDYTPPQERDDIPAR